MRLFTPAVLALIDACFKSAMQFDIVVAGTDGGFYSVTGDTSTTAIVYNSSGYRIGTMTADV